MLEIKLPLHLNDIVILRSLYLLAQSTVISSYLSNRAITQVYLPAVTLITTEAEYIS